MRSGEAWRDLAQSMGANFAKTNPDDRRCLVRPGAAYGGLGQSGAESAVYRCGLGHYLRKYLAQQTNTQCLIKVKFRLPCENLCVGRYG